MKAGKVVDRSSIAYENDMRYPSYPVHSGHTGDPVHVDFVHDRPAAVRCGDIVEGRSEYPAGSAPVGIKIEYDETIVFALQHFLQLTTGLDVTDRTRGAGFTTVVRTRGPLQEDYHHRRKNRNAASPCGCDAPPEAAGWCVVSICMKFCLQR